MLRHLAILGALGAILLIPKPSQGQPGPLEVPDEYRESTVVAVPDLKPAENPWHDVRPMLGAVGAFVSADLILSLQLNPRADIAQVVLAGGLAAPLLDFSIRLYAFRGYDAMSKLGRGPPWLYATLGTAFVGYGLWRTIHHTRRVFWGKGSKKAPSIIIVPYAASGVFGLSIGGSFFDLF